MIPSIWKLRSRLFDVYALRSYSQEGEDMILRRLLEHVPRGFYVDVGACHPKRFSNTYFFYKKGWTGLNLDATPGSMRAFERGRPRDNNIEVAITRDRRPVTLFLFDDPALNSLSPALSGIRVAEGYKIVRRENVPSKTLEDILQEHVPVGQRIHFLSVDAEGADLEVLQSSNWNTHRPDYVLVESIHCRSLEDALHADVTLFLTAHDYTLFAKTLNTLIFASSHLDTMP